MIDAKTAHIKSKEADIQMIADFEKNNESDIDVINGEILKAISEGKMTASIQIERLSKYPKSPWGEELGRYLRGKGYLRSLNSFYLNIDWSEPENTEESEVQE